MQGDIFVAAKAEEFEVHPNQCLKLFKTSYGPSKSDGIWYETFAAHCENDLELKIMRPNPELCYMENHGTLHGICRAYVDDLLSAGDKVFKMKTELKREKLKMAEEERPLWEFSVFALTYNKNKIWYRISHTT